jgi:hypothetical protein
MYTQKKYPTSQAVFYLIAQIIIDNLRANMEKMSEFSSRYTDDFADNLQLSLDTAIALPNDAARTLEHETIRLAMVDMLPDTLKAWKRLKRYIAKAFGPDEDSQRAYWNAAGWAHYEGASNRNWPSVNALMEAGSQFLVTHSAALLANNNMPAGFPVQFNAQALAMATKQIDFTTAKQAAQVGTETKTIAENTTYDAIVTVCLDGQVEFEGTITEQQFSFSAVEKLVSPPTGFASLAIEALNKTTQTALSGVEALIVGTDKQTVTNTQGKGQMDGLTSATVQLKFMCDGFADLFMPYTIQPGVNARLTIELEPLAIEIPEAVAPQPTPEVVNA